MADPFTSGTTVGDTQDAWVEATEDGKTGDDLERELQVAFYESANNTRLDEPDDSTEEPVNQTDSTDTYQPVQTTDAAPVPSPSGGADDRLILLGVAALGAAVVYAQMGGGA
jgi:hypothetical protein